MLVAEGPPPHHPPVWYINYLDKNNPRKPLRVINGHSKSIQCLTVHKNGSKSYIYSESHDDTLITGILKQENCWQGPHEPGIQDDCGGVQAATELQHEGHGVIYQLQATAL